jgi:hypothetical protein
VVAVEAALVLVVAFAVSLVSLLSILVVPLPLVWVVLDHRLAFPGSSPGSEPDQPELGPGLHADETSLHCP